MTKSANGVFHQENASSLSQEVVLVWKSFCELHHGLYNITCREYQLLLSSRIDAVDENLKDKIKIINEIKSVESKRRGLVRSLSVIVGRKIINIRDLLGCLCDRKEDHQLLEKYNEILMKTIGEIQEQNKKNQIFINKASHNLKVIREEVMGQDCFSTYDSKGKASQYLG